MDNVSHRGVLSGGEIRKLLEGEPPLVSGFADLDAQLQPNGFDLTLAEIRSFVDQGTMGVDNARRILPGLSPVEPGADGLVHLPPGPYHITYSETVALPTDLMAFGRPRSSLTRSGVAIHTAVWDAGYAGRSTSLLVVSNPHGFTVEIGARVAQLVFLRLSVQAEQGYAGIYQGENARR
jgi:dUTP pyrophosphatase